MTLYTLLAQVKNPALPAGFQNAADPVAAGVGLGKYIGILWQTALVVGGLAVVAYMIMGGLNWITAAGDKGKIETAKERITQGLIGLAVLFSVAAISTFFGTVLGLDLLKPNFARITPTSDAPSGGGSGGESNGLCAIGDISSYEDARGEYGCSPKNIVQMKCVGPNSTFNYIHWTKDKCL